jgi:hypothetical protein
MIWGYGRTKMLRNVDIKYKSAKLECLKNNNLLSFCFPGSQRIPRRGGARWNNYCYYDYNYRSYWNNYNYCSYWNNYNDEKMSSILFDYRTIQNKMTTRTNFK